MEDPKVLNARLASIEERYLHVRNRDNPMSVPPPRVYGLGGSRVRVMQLTCHIDARGWLVEAFRESWTRIPSEVDDHANENGARQVYLSATEPGVIKGWHLHQRQSDRFVCVAGRILLCLCDPFEPGAPVHEIVLDSCRSPKMVIVPPYVAHGWMALGNTESLVLNSCSHEYDGTDEWRIDPHAPPFSGLPAHDWRINRDG